MRARLVLTGVCLVFGICVAATAQRRDAFVEPRDHAAIAYSRGPVANAAETLNARLRGGEASLRFEPGGGYLRSLLDALSIPAESQALVYSQTSFQARKIDRSNPRAVYFNEQVAVGFVRGGDILEIAAQDARQGTIFYTLQQSVAEPPVLQREDHCLSCHLSWETRGVPGPIVLTVMPRRSEDEYANGSFIDHRAPLAERWGGWYVTGTRVPPSMANLELLQPKMPESGPRPVAARTSLAGLFDTSGYAGEFSDVVALMVLEHQVHATNLITRAGWEHRVGSPNAMSAIEELVDYLLFVDEAPLPHPVKGSSGFAERFASLGPRDSRGRSLRELDLKTRLMRYPLSYMIYSPGFVGLPDAVKREVWSRIDAVLAGKNAHKRYAHLTLPARTSIREIVAETREGAGHQPR